MTTSEPNVPKVLKGKLVFGDPEQITALKGYVADCETFYGDGTLKRFRVSISVDYSGNEDVEACTPNEAIAKVQDGFSVSAVGDFDIHFDAEEIGGQE